MAKASISSTEPNLKPFTDCMYFINGHCKLNDKCRYRHCPEATTQTNKCYKWPKTCRNIKCPYRHPSSLSKPTNKIPSLLESSIGKSSPAPPPPPPARQAGLICFFWDIENVPIPRAQKPFDIVQRIRQKLVVDSGLREYSFSCFCNSNTISQENQLNLFHANVRIVHIPDRKSGAVDRQIMLELDRFERAHHPPATIVLLSGDIDFVGKLSDLRHQAGFHVIVIHNKPAKEELKATVNAHYAWELFTQQTNVFDSSVQELTTRTPQPYAMRSTGNNLRRVDPSPVRSSPPVKQKPTTNTRETKKQIHHCPKCTNEFDSIQALRQHQEAKDHLFDCPICDESFVTLDGLTQHQKAKGHNIEEYKCEQCNRCFGKIDSLDQHRQSTGHTGMTILSSSNNNGFIHEQSTSPSLPKTNKKTKNDVVHDAAMVIIQQGIEALVQHYPVFFPKNK